MKPQETVTWFAFVGEAGLRNLVLYPEDTQVRTQRPEPLCRDPSLEKTTQGFGVVCVASTPLASTYKCQLLALACWIEGRPAD